MASLISKAKELARLALGGHTKVAVRAVLRRLYWKSSAIGLRRDLSQPFQAPSANVQIVVRALRPDDNLAFLDSGGEGDFLTRFAQLRMLRANIETCYVAVAPNGDICYMQWLIPPSQNEKIKANFGSLFPQLKENEALLEAAYTVPAYRGQRIMASAMAQIAEKGTQFGARWAITFVGQDNEPSLKGCARAGFEPYILRWESWRMFHRSIEFSPLSPPDDSRVLA